MKVQKKAKAADVNKALSPEETAIVANIKSLLDQLEQTSGTDEGNDLPAPDGDEVAMSADGDGDEDGVEEVFKDETADASAEERVGEDPSETEEALSVLKAIMKMGAGQVKKSRPVDPMLSTLQGIAKALQGINQRVDEQGQAIVGILEGMGVADQVATVQKSARRPVQSAGADAAAVLKALMAAAGQSQPAQEAEPEGSLKDVLIGLTGR